MKKMKAAVIVSFLLFPAVIGVFGVTSAYFNSKAKAQNVITSGNIKMELRQTDKEGNPIDQDRITDIMPGDTIDRNITVENTGKQPLYAKLKINCSLGSLVEENSDEILFEKESGDILIDVNTDDWEYKDGYYYYKTKLNPGETSKPLIRGIQISKNAGNDYADIELSLAVNAAGVQCKNNTESALTATGWPAE